VVVSALGALFWRGGLVLAAGFLVVLLAANAPLYTLFWRRRGLLFALQGIVWNWFYYLYGGLGFAVGLGLHLLERRRQCTGEFGPKREG